MLFSLSASLPFVLALAAAPQAIAGSIEWQTCTDINVGGTVPLLCANLSAPLDYTDSSSDKKLTLQLLKVPATQPSTNESILFNFGGPGESNRLTMAILATKMLNMTGGTHDLISFDTRGTDNTLPFLCFKDDAERNLFALMAPASGRASDVALGAQWATGQYFAETCYAANNNNETGTLIGTPFVARDMMQIVDALDEGGLLRYWGFSYGTVLGATVAAMFPDKMDKVLLDGVVNVFEFNHGYDIEKYTDTDKTFEGFVSTCVASPQNCALAASGNVTTTELLAKLYGMIDDLKYNPIVLGGYIIDYSWVKSVILGSLYTPVLWPSLALALDGVLARDAAKVLPLLELLLGGDIRIAEYMFGIECSDKTPRAASLDEIRPFADRLFATSNFSDVQSAIFAKCAQWPLEAKERYTGDFQVKTRKPILLIGNTYDPVTPLVSARNVSAGFDGSVVLQHNGYGHASIQQPSACTIEYIQDFFATGELPAPGTICEPDFPPFHSA